MTKDNISTVLSCVSISLFVIFVVEKKITIKVTGAIIWLRTLPCRMLTRIFAILQTLRGSQMSWEKVSIEVGKNSKLWFTAAHICITIDERKNWVVSNICMLRENIVILDIGILFDLYMFSLSKPVHISNPATFKWPRCHLKTSNKYICILKKKKKRSEENRRQSKGRCENERNHKVWVYKVAFVYPLQNSVSESINGV